MRVICTNNTKRLVKGAVYEVVRLENFNTKKNQFFRSYITIKLNDSLQFNFNVNNFKLEDGNPIPEINWQSDESKNKGHYWTQSRITDENIKKGDYVVYLRNSHKNLIQDKKYKVEDIQIKKHSSKWGGLTHTTWNEILIKIEGSTRFYKAYSFRKCTPQETRDISLKVLFDEKTGVEKVDKSSRKIDKLDEITRQRLLIKILFSAALDYNRNNMTVQEWAISKTGIQYSLKESDFNSILNSQLNSLLSLID